MKEVRSNAGVSKKKEKTKIFSTNATLAKSTHFVRKERRMCMLKIIKEQETKQEVATGKRRKLLETGKKNQEEKEELIPKEDVIVHKLSEDVISSLKFLNIIDRMNSILESYEEICADLEYKKNNEIYLDLIKIENALSNIESTLACELKNKIKDTAEG